MSDYIVIARITEVLIERLRSGMCPDIIYSRGDIGASSDRENSGYILSLYLYGISKEDGTPVNSVPPGTLALRLEYMLTADSKGEGENKALDEQRILGKAAEILRSPPYIPSFTEAYPAPSIEMDTLSLYDRSSLSPKKTSMFYFISPVFISGETKQPAPRVTEIGGER